MFRSTILEARCPGGEGEPGEEGEEGGRAMFIVSSKAKANS